MSRALPWAAALLGVATLSACTCPGPTRVAPAVYGAEQIEALGIEDYRLEIAQDRSEVVETFVKEGRHYLLRYRVLGARNR